MRELLFVSCTRGGRRGTALDRSLSRLGAEVWFFENNTCGLPSRYNRVIDDLAGSDRIVVFLHDDVAVADVFVQDKLNHVIEDLGFAIAGLAGATSLDLTLDQRFTAWWHAPPEHRSGAVDHRMPSGRDLWTTYGSTPRRCLVLDGLLLAVDMQRIGHVRFDEQFRFHFYDLDFCLSAHHAGLRLGTVNVYAHHGSIGQLGLGDSLEQQARFREKWRDRIVGRVEVDLDPPPSAAARR